MELFKIFTRAIKNHFNCQKFTEPPLLLFKLKKLYKQDHGEKNLQRIRREQAVQRTS